MRVRYYIAAIENDRLLGTDSTINSLIDLPQGQVNHDALHSSVLFIIGQLDPRFDTSEAWTDTAARAATVIKMSRPVQRDCWKKDEDRIDLGVGTCWLSLTE